MNKIEILSPAGDFDSLMAAVNNGADAVYLGGSRFSARRSAANFDNAQLEQAVEYAHLRGVKVYVALNTLIHEDELADAYDFIAFCCKIGVDALIVQDLAVVYMINKYFPNMRIHASTQMTVHNVMGANAVANLGFERVVLSRELSFDEIKSVCDGSDIEIEVFAHGALCMCYSGQCLMSSLIGGRSGNRGACAQPCRLPYTLYDKDKNVIGVPDKYYMSLKDLCTVDTTDTFADIGVTSLKIEGRMKSSEYVAIVTGIYNKYRNGGKVAQDDMRILENVFSRSGFTTGYLNANTGKHMLNADSHNDDVYRNIEDDVHSVADILKNVKKLNRADIYVNITLGELPYIVMTCGDISVTAYGESEVQAALRSATPAERIREQIVKLGGTAFEAWEVECSVDDGINISIKDINNLRRKAVEMLENAILSKSKPQSAHSAHVQYDYVKATTKSKPVVMTASVRTFEQATEAAKSGFERVYVPASLYFRHRDYFDSDKGLFVMMMPSIAGDSLIDKYKNCSLDAVCVSNISQINAFSGKKLYANYSMNVYNSMSQQLLTDMGVSSVCLSPELNMGQISSACGVCDTEIVVYGRICLMTVRNCLVKSSTGKCGCSDDVRYMKDRKGIYFPFYTNTDNCTNTVYNSVPVYMGDRCNELSKLPVSAYRFDFTDESAQELHNVVQLFRSGNKMPEGSYTRGHYYRGVE